MANEGIENKVGGNVPNFDIQDEIGPIEISLRLKRLYNLRPKKRYSTYYKKRTYGN